MASKRSKRSSLLKRALWLVIAGIAVAFAVEGGEFGTTDLLRNRRDMRRLEQSTDSVKRVLAALKAYKDSVEKDPSVQERIAREQFGMVRGDKELMYRFTDSVRKARSP
jgi:cell division protein FtsB